MRTLFAIAIGILLLAACQPAASDVETPPGMAAVPAGWFWMGQDEGPRSNRPQHRVYLDGYFIDRTEVTRAEFAEFIAAGGLPDSAWNADMLRADPDLPVTGALWQEADAYCRGLTTLQRTDGRKRARHRKRIYPWGSRWDQRKQYTEASWCCGCGGQLS